MSLPRWTTEELDATVERGGAVLAELRADWCVRCGPQEQVLERLVPEYTGRIVIGAIDVAEHPEAADRYAVQGVPAFLLFSHGAHRQTIQGFRRAPELREALRNVLVDGGSSTGGDLDA